MKSSLAFRNGIRFAIFGAAFLLSMCTL